ncbi:unnamed protein product [Diatraea saccharalis]|uniref:Uncharacterized protein n=1 Tax=Diatraea saccharalis TaxID=40085 RepID=A0A9N9R8R7_9NEOP|nr:unnamed protein product [Diatraea saccharalis]
MEVHISSIAFVLLLINFGTCLRLKNDTNDISSSNDSINKIYRIGVDMGIINTEKYAVEAFARDEQNVFRDLYKEYISMNGSRLIHYDEWLVMNNFGVLPDTQESLFERKITKRSTADNKRRFVNTVRKGDILITGRGIGGLLGHAAIMTTNNYVLEMRGGNGWQNGIKRNNRQISKHRWFDEHRSDWTTVYRCPNAAVANGAALWADHKYYNPTGGSQKKIHITYKITLNVWSINPSYCSKLVIQAYYFGSGKRKVISRDISLRRVIVPTMIPSYFLAPYKLRNMGRF